MKFLFLKRRFLVFAMFYASIAHLTKIEPSFRGEFVEHKDLHLSCLYRRMNTIPFVSQGQNGEMYT